MFNRKRKAEQLGRVLLPSNIIVSASLAALIMLKDDPYFGGDAIAFTVTFCLSSASFFALKSVFSDENLSCFGGAVVALAVFLLSGAFLQLSEELVFFTTALTFTMILLSIFRSRWGISGHVTAATLVSTLLTQMDVRFVFLYALVPVLGWSRLEVRAHNFSQVVFGALLGLSLPLIYLLLG